MALFKKNCEKCKFWPPDGALVHFFATRWRFLRKIVKNANFGHQMAL